MGTVWQDKTLLRNTYENLHYDPASDDLVIRVVNKPETFVWVNQYQYLSDILHQQQALVAQVAESVEKAEGTSSGIEYKMPPKDFADTMSREGESEWMEAYRKEYQGFKDRDVWEWSFIHTEQRSLDRQLVLSIKLNKACIRNKSTLCARGDQLVHGVHDSYSPVLKATEARLMTALAIAAEHGCNLNIYKTNTKHVFFLVWWS